MLCRWGASLLERPHGYGLLHLAAGLAQPASLTFLLDGGADANGAAGLRARGWTGGSKRA